jgi:multimeric flavodoxin WrbA
VKTLILDGSHANEPQAVHIRTALGKDLPDAETVIPREQKIGNCAGDFFCWVRNPGICNINDDNRTIAAKVVRSELVIYLTPVTFGGYSSELKRMVDHQIQNISPFFASIQGEVHHQKRYKRYPNLLVIGWMDQANAQAEAIFRYLVHRNAINMYAKTSVCGLVTGTPSEADLEAQTGLWLKAIGAGASSPVPALPATDISSADAAPIRRAVLLVGSPRTRKSTSVSLGGYLFEQLNTRGIETQTIQIYTSLYSGTRMNGMYEAIDNADLVVLAFPLYVDSLPGPVTAALEKIALHRKDNQTPVRFVAIANCGFPEANHNDTALAICSEFARQAGLTWMGGLALGAGQGLVHGTPLNELDGRAIPIKGALDLAAEALASGNPIPPAARDLLAKPIIPNWMYTLQGQFGWRQAARQYGMEKELKRQPYLSQEKSHDKNI